MYGLFVKGTAGNLILGDENKVLVLKHSAPMYVSRMHRYWSVTSSVKRIGGQRETIIKRRINIPKGYGFVEETYPQPVTTTTPPMIFGTPNGEYDGGGIGGFIHIGSPGNWTGFQMIFAYDLYYTKVMNRDSIVGQPTGWTYHLCAYGDAPSKDKYGLRIWDSKQDLVFDSGWKIVPFRPLLMNWKPEDNNPTRYYNILNYWGMRSSGGDIDYVYQVGYQPWGYQNNDRGVLISSIQAHDFRGDTGDNDYEVLRCMPIVGFKGRDRTRIYCSIAYGVLQHPFAAVSVMSKYQILSADFSKAYKPNG